ncbi:hypothetical protein EBR04_08640, partial [bacterium]|nr:hypothetical protein [bacterium]
MQRLTWLLVAFVAVLVPLVFVLTLATKHDLTTAAFFSLAVGVGLTPEMLPMIVAVCLSRGAMVMAKARVIVKHLDSIQNLGAMDVLCTDKTGTLTLDRIILERHCDLLLREDQEVLRIGWLVSHFQTGLRSAMDRAVLEHEELRGRDPSVGHAKLDEIPFDFTRRVMSVVVAGPDGGPRLFCKGAVDAVHARCTAFEIDGVVRPIDHDLPRAVLKEADALAADGFRVLAVAYRAVAAKPSYGRDDERDLVLRGYLAFLDPPKDSARGALEALAAGGVAVKVLTGDNELVAVVRNAGGLAGFSCRLVLTDPDGGVRVVESDQSWSAFDTLSQPNPVTLRVVAGPGNGPWGDVLAAPRKATAAPFTVPQGFRVERLFVVPKEEFGSWVCLTTDPKGRLIASDQGDKGLVRITPAPLDGSGETVVEKIPVPITGAQGLLWAFDALYAVCNGGPGSGLYRITDANADDTLDTVEKLRDFEGGGEHGPHNILLSPDGSRLFVICGNHTQVPFTVKNLTEPQTMGGIRSTQRRVELAADGASRLPANWDEDQIVPRMWDAGGHAVGILAPGGYVASTDRDGKAWEIWTAGYRNPYD